MMNSILKNDPLVTAMHFPQFGAHIIIALLQLYII